MHVHRDASNFAVLNVSAYREPLRDSRNQDAGCIQDHVEEPFLSALSTSGACLLRRGLTGPGAARGQEQQQPVAGLGILWGVVHLVAGHPDQMMPVQRLLHLGPVGCRGGQQPVQAVARSSVVRVPVYVIACSLDLLAQHRFHVFAPNGHQYPLTGRPGGLGQGRSQDIPKLVAPTSETIHAYCITSCAYCAIEHLYGARESNRVAG